MATATSHTHRVCYRMAVAQVTVAPKQRLMVLCPWTLMVSSSSSKTQSCKQPVTQLQPLQRLVQIGVTFLLR